MDGVVSGESTELKCLTIAILEVETDPSGTQWRAPRGYAKNRKELTADRRELVFVYPTGALSPESAGPLATTNLVALFDVLGFEMMLREVGLATMYRKYDAMIKRAFLAAVAEDRYSLARGMLAGELRDGYLKLPIRYAYFSDTLLIWTPLHNAFVGTFMDRCSSLICNALALDIPLRGAISVGEAILHKRSNTYIGEALVEAARLEAAQNVIGACLGQSVRSISFPPNRVQRYIQPVKEGKEDLLSGLVLDWPRFWRDTYRASLVERIRALRSESFAKYYDSALDFVAFSEANSLWFAAEVEAQIGKFTQEA